MSQLRTAVVGVKGVGRGHLQSIREHARTDLVAVADLDAAAACAAVGDTSARAYTGFDALLASETDLDAVVLSRCQKVRLHQVYDFSQKLSA